MILALVLRIQSKETALRCYDATKTGIIRNQYCKPLLLLNESLKRVNDKLNIGSIQQPRLLITC